MLHVYYIDLLELTVALIFLVVLKILLLYLMNKVGAVVSDDPKPDRKPDKPHLSGFLNQFRWALGVVLVLNAVWQIRPAMLFVHAHRLMEAGSSAAVAHWWTGSANWLNIWSVLITLSFAALLLSFSGPMMVRIVSAVFAVYAFAAWIWLVALHNWSAVPSTFLAGLPGAGLLLAFATLPLIFQSFDWKPVFKMGIFIYWLLFGLLQLIPGNGFWSGRGYAVLGELHPATALSFFASMDGRLQHFGSTHAIIMTIVLVLIAWLIAAGWMTTRFAGIAGTVGIVYLLFIWLGFNEAGFGGAYLFALGSTPVVILWMVYTQFYGRNQHLSYEQNSDVAKRS